MQQNHHQTIDMNNSYIMMNNEEDQRMREGRSFGDPGVNADEGRDVKHKSPKERFGESALDLIEN